MSWWKTGVPDTSWRCQLTQRPDQGNVWGYQRAFRWYGVWLSHCKTMHYDVIAEPIRAAVQSFNSTPCVTNLWTKCNKVRVRNRTEGGYRNTGSPWDSICRSTIS